MRGQSRIHVRDRAPRREDSGVIGEGLFGLGSGASASDGGREWPVLAGEGGVGLADRRKVPPLCCRVRGVGETGVLGGEDIDEGLQGKCLDDIAQIRLQLSGRDPQPAADL